MNRLSQIGVAALGTLALNSKPALAETDFCDVPYADLVRSKFLLYLGGVQMGDESAIEYRKSMSQMLIPKNNREFGLYQPVSAALVVNQERVPSIQFEYKDPDGISKTFYSGAYQEKIPFGSHEYLVVTEQYPDPLEKCPDSELEENTAETAPSEPASESSQERTPWPMEFSAALIGGVNEEDTGRFSGGYSLGEAGIVGGVLTFRPSPLPICVGATTFGLISEEGSGYESATGFLAYCDDRFLVGAVAGGSGEPREPESILNGAPTVGLLAMADVYSKGPFSVNAGLTARHDIIGGGGLTGTAFAGLKYKLDLDVERAVKTPRTESISTRTLEVESDANFRIVSRTEAYVPAQVDVAEYEGKLTLEARKAEAVRLSDDMQRLAARNVWKGVEASYQSSLELKVELKFRDYKNAIDAATALGDLKSAYERTLIALPLVKEGSEREDLITRIADYERVYASVRITFVGTLNPRPELVVETPFEPGKRTALEKLREAWAQGLPYEGFLPVMVYDDPNEKIIYHVGEQSFTLEALGSGEGSQQTIVIELVK